MRTEIESTGLDFPNSTVLGLMKHITILALISGSPTLKR